MTLQVSDPGGNSQSQHPPPLSGSEPSGWRHTAGLRQARPPFNRLTPYTVAHQLIHRLEPYVASDVSLMCRTATWATLVYWARLLETEEVREPVAV